MKELEDDMHKTERDLRLLVKETQLRYSKEREISKRLYQEKQRLKQLRNKMRKEQQALGVIEEHGEEPDRSRRQEEEAEEAPSPTSEGERLYEKEHEKEKGQTIDRGNIGTRNTLKIAKRDFHHEGSARKGEGTEEANGRMKEELKI